MKLRMLGAKAGGTAAVLGLAGALMVAAVRPAEAQLTLGLGGGLTAPVGSISNTYGSGFNALADLGVRVPAVPIGFRADLMFNQLPVKSSFGSGHTQIYSASANVVLQAPGMVLVSPYLIAGVGYYDTHFSVTANGGNVSAGGNLSASHSNAGVNGGVGLKLGLPGTGIGLFGEVRYHYVFESASHYSMVPITVGINF